MVHNEIIPEWPQIQTLILELEKEGVVTRTFRRLDPERQQAIVYAILDEAIAKGPAAINIKQVAERAGMAVGSLYQYFGNRAGLMSFTTRLCVHLLTESFLQYKPFLVAMPLREALSAYLTGGVEWGRMMQGLVQFFGKAAYAGTPELAEKVVRPVAIAMREMTHEILLAAQARGELRPEVDIDATTRAINAWIIPVADSQLFPYLNLYFQTSDEKSSVSAHAECVPEYSGTRTNNFGRNKMTDLGLLWLAGGFFLLFSAFSLWFLRREYRLNGKLSWFGSILHVVMYAVDGMFCALIAWGPTDVPPMGPLGWLGIVFMGLGLGLTVYAMDLFRTFSRWLGNDTPGFATNGIYRYSRNPQFVGYGLLILGFFIAWWNTLAWLGLLSYAALVYAVTLVEEEHLKRTYGDSYRAYCQRVPRYFGIPKE